MIDKFKQFNRGVSNAVGVIILIGITVILAAVIGNFIFGLSYFEEPVNAGATIDVTNSSAEVVWDTNQNGELVEVQVNNNLVETLNSVGSTATLTDLSTGDRITAVGVRKDQSQTLTSATVSNGLETEGEDTIPTQNTTLIKSLPNSKDTSSDGWSVFQTSNGSISDYTTNSNLQITDSTNTYTELPLYIYSNPYYSYYQVDETRVKIDVDSINSGTPTYEIGYDYDASTNSFNGNTLSQGELDEGVNNISITPTSKSTPLNLVVEGGSSVDVVYNSIQFESLVDARSIPVQYPEGNEWSNNIETSNEIRSDIGISEAEYTISDSTLLKTSSDNSYQYSEPLNVSNTEYINITADIQKLSGDGYISGNSVTEGENTITVNVQSQNIFTATLVSVKEINSFQVEPIELSENIDTTFTITNKDTGEVVPNADVTIDGTTKTTDSNGEVTFSISQGETNIELSKEGYGSETKTRLIASEQVSIQYDDNIKRVSSATELTSAIALNEPVQLQNDIDYSQVTSGFKKQNFDYNSEFNGNGYSITNFDISSTDKNTSFVNLGTEGIWKDTTFEGGTVENNAPDTSANKRTTTHIFEDNEGTISNVTFNNISLKGSEFSSDEGIVDNYTSILGDNKGTIEDTVIKNSSISGNGDISGLANMNDTGTIENITVENTTITNNSEGETAGLVSTNSYDNTPADELIRNITMTDVTINAVEDAGGITVSNNAVIEDVTVSNLQLTGNENGKGSVGGITVFNDSYAEINNTSVTGSITGLTGEPDVLDYVGGIAGESEGDITNSTSEATVTGNNGVGGLVGNLSGTVSNSVAKGDVIVNIGSEFNGSYSNSDSGGFAGSLSGEGEINQSYSTGNVTVTGYAKNIGGFIGEIYSSDSQKTVSNSYSTGNVVASNSTSVGGFVGETDIRDTGSILIENSYSTGSVSGSNNIGGFVGRNDATINSSYWDTESSGLSDSDGGTGLTTSEMTGSSASSNMTGFDYTNTWTTVSGDYPDLQE